MISPVPWRYRIVTRQTVPILIGLTGLITLLIALGYFFAREQILNTVNAQVRQFGNSILREDNHNREWLARSMPMLLHKAERAFLQKPFDENTLNNQILASMSEARGKMLVEILTLSPHVSDMLNAPRIEVRLYDDEGQLQPDKKQPFLCGKQSAKDIENLDKAFWPAPQIDEQRTLHVRYAAPLKNSLGKTFGIITTSLAIPWFMERIRSFSFFKQCIPFFLTTNGQWTLPSSADKDLKKLKQHMLEDKGKFYTAHWNGKRYVAITLTSAESSLLIGALVPYEDLFGYLDTISKTLAVLGLIVLLLAVYALQKTCNALLSPLGYLAKTAENLSQGKIHPHATMPSTSHFLPQTEQLLTATKQLSSALQQRMHDLTVMAQTSERLSGELDLARTIQNSLRPATLPLMKGVELAASVHAAREVCGDMYDCFALSEHEICCVMGNVAEHGMAAALLTNRIMPLLHELLLSGLSPAEALQQVNAGFDVAPSTERALHITSFVGILHSQTGQLRFASAGQFPPFIVESATPSPQCKQLPYPQEKALGFMQQAHYTEMRIQLEPMQTLFFIPERLLSVQNMQGHSYTRSQLDDFFAHTQNTPTTLIEAFYEHIFQYTQGNLHDDVVLFAMQWQGGKLD